MTDVLYVRSFSAKGKKRINSMNEQTKSESKPDDVTATTEPRSTELTAEELEQVSGGAETSHPANPCCG